MTRLVVVYVVNLTEEEDGIYVFADMEQAEMFKALHGNSALLTEEPILDEVQGALLIREVEG